MFLNEVHEQLYSSEFAQAFIGEGSTLNPTLVPKLNVLIQAGINDLNKQFSIRENELLLRTKLGKDIYELIPANAVSTGNQYGFIIDSIESPFKGDIMQIFRVTDSTGKSLFLNTDVPYRVPSDNIFGVRPDVFNYDGINLLSYNTIKLHQGHDLGDLLVHYKAKMPKLDTTLNPEDVYIDLPDHFLNALVMYTASRWFNPYGSENIGQGQYNEAANYWNKYLAEIAELKANLGSIASTGETTAFIRGGWV